MFVCLARVTLAPGAGFGPRCGRKRTNQNQTLRFYLFIAYLLREEREVIASAHTVVYVLCSCIDMWMKKGGREEEKERRREKGKKSEEKRGSDCRCQQEGPQWNARLPFESKKRSTLGQRVQAKASGKRGTHIWTRYCSVYTGLEIRACKTDAGEEEGERRNRRQFIFTFSGK